MKRVTSYSLAILFILSCLNGYSQVPPVGIAESFGGTGTDACWGIAVDAQGNTYTGGYFNGTTTVGQTTLTSLEDLDLMVTKHNAQGVAQWAISFGWVLQDMAFTIAADAAGNSYLTARWFNRITVDGTTYFANNDGKDIGVFKIDTDGNLVWFTAFGGSGTDTPNDIAVDANGNVFITGQFVNDFTFNGQTQQSNGSDDVFVAKLNADGTEDWFSTFGSSFGDIGRAIAVDGAGNCYVSGNARGNSIIDAIVNLNAGGNNYDAFLVKYTNSGVVQWANAIGGINSDYAYGLDADANGNTYMAGSFFGNTNIDGIELTGSGSSTSDGFVAKFDSNGDVDWANGIGGSGNDIAYEITSDNSGNAYVIGQFIGNINIDGTNLTNQGNSDAFVVKIDNAGTFDWATSIGGIGIDYGYGIAVDQGGNCYAGGYFADEITIGSNTLVSNGDYDVFIVRYGNATVTNIPEAAEQNQELFEIGRYNILGQPVNKDYAGLQIVHYSDGSCQKVQVTNFDH